MSYKVFSATRVAAPGNGFEIIYLVRLARSILVLLGMHAVAPLVVDVVFWVK